MRVLYIGDVFGTLGQEALRKYLPKLKQDFKPHLIFLNAENIDRGFGITEEIYKELMTMGISVLTMGNHTFRNRKIFDFIQGSNIVRPLNYDDSVPGVGYKTIQFNGEKVTVVNLLGRVFMGDPLDNPFKLIDQLLPTLDSDYVFIDFHAEATSEKVALGYYLDGIANVVVGTHTHVPTADERALPNGTLYITDVGMTGPLNGVIGVSKEIVLDRFLNGFAAPNEVATGTKQLNAVMLDLVKKTIERIHIESETV